MIRFNGINDLDLKKNQIKWYLMLESKIFN